MKKNILLVIAMLWVFTACDNKAKENTTDETTTSETTGTPGVKTSADGNNTAGKTNDLTVSKSTDNTVEKSGEEGPKADIKFEKTEHDFGEISEGTLAKHTFNFTNTGKVPLIIKDARGSCGCTRNNFV